MSDAAGVCCREFVVLGESVEDEGGGKTGAEGDGVGEHGNGGEAHELDGVERGELAVGEWPDGDGEGDDGDDDRRGEQEESPEVGEDVSPESGWCTGEHEGMVSRGDRGWEIGSCLY